MPQIGRAVLGNDVEIGSCSSIDRGAIGDTEIADGVKVDSQVHIAHNVRVGKHTAVACCAAFAGSSRIGAYCTIAGGPCACLGYDGGHAFDQATRRIYQYVTGDGACELAEELCPSAAPG